MTLRRLPASLLLLLALQIPVPFVQAAPLPPPPRELALALLPPLPPPNTPASLLYDLVRKAEEHDVPLVTRPVPTSTTTAGVGVSFAEASAAPPEPTMVSPFVSSAEDSSSSGSGSGSGSGTTQLDGYSASKPLAPAMIGVIAGLVTVLFGLALFALYRSQRKKNASRRELLERERTRASSSSVRSEGSGGEGAGERKERAGSYSSQGTMVERDMTAPEKGAGLVKKMSPTSALS